MLLVHLLAKAEAHRITLLPSGYFFIYAANSSFKFCFLHNYMIKFCTNWTNKYPNLLSCRKLTDSSDLCM